jgi:hypothetical protein
VSSEYDPIGRSRDSVTVDDDLESVRDRFERAGRPYLSSPWSWLAWAFILPATALATPVVLDRFGRFAVLMLWSVGVLVGGAVEVSQIMRGRGRQGTSTPLAAWVLRIQGNLSLVGLALSMLLVAGGLTWALAGLWLLILGHSFYVVGGLSFPPLRTSGLIYQAGGLLALWPEGSPLAVCAATVFVGNLWTAWGIWRRRPSSS